jgi:hypothetical protein
LRGEPAPRAAGCRKAQRRFTVRIVTTYSNGSKRTSIRSYRRCGKSKPQTRRGGR